MKDIMLKITGKQISDENEEKIEFITEGQYSKEGGTVLLSYEESELSGMEGCVTNLKITDEKIRMERSGNLIGEDTAIEFEKGRRFSNSYNTPFGSIKMEVLTNSIINKLDDKGKGTLDIDYHISLQGISDARSHLSIEII